MLKVSAQKFGNVSILRLRGRLVICEMDVLGPAISLLTHTTLVFLDFAGVTGIDARGLGILLTLRQAFQKQGIQLRLVNVTRSVRRVFEISRLDSVFDIASEPEIEESIDQTREFKRVCALDVR